MRKLMVTVICLCIFVSCQNQGYDLKFAPYLHWKAKDGRRLNTDNSIPNKIVYMFGGSTVFCPNVVDSLTLPNCLSRELGKDYVVCNYGQSGYIVRQQLIYLLECLIENQSRPDIVIFYDGVNDILNTARNGKAGTLMYQKYRAKDFRMSTSIKRIALNYDPLAKFRNNLNFKLSPKLTKVAVESEIRECIQIMSVLSEHFGFRFYHFEQPTIFHKQYLDHFECDAHNKYLKLKPYYCQDYFSCAYDITDVFDNTQQQVFEDFCHVSARGNELIAKRISQIILGN